MRVGITEAIEREVPEQIEAPYREVNKEIRELTIESIVENGNSEVPEETLVPINYNLKDEIKEGQRTKNYKKSFAVVEAIVNGKKKVITFANIGLAIKIMNHIKEVYNGKVNLKYNITQV